MAIREAACDLINYINRSPSPYHAVAEAIQILKKVGYQRLDEAADWNLAPGGMYYLTRNASTLIAFALGEKFTPGNGCQLIGAHTDSPCLRVKQRSKHASVGYGLVKCECYGGGIWATWFDRDLKLAGKVIVRGQDNKLTSRLAHIDRPILHVPTLAIHLDRTVNEAFKFNKEEQLIPVLRMVEKELEGEKKVTGVEKQQQPFTKHHDTKLIGLLSDHLGCSGDDIVGFDLCLADSMPAGLAGLDEEFLMAPRQDNLVNAWAGTEALAKHNPAGSSTAAVLCLYDHEEVGSQSAHGAGTQLTNLVLERICGNNTGLLAKCISKSFLLSADQVHAVHPNYVSKHESNFQPAINGGVTMKHNSNQRYATTAMGAAQLRELARRNEIPLQEVMVRNDSPCGSTIGPIISAKTALRTVDLGCPQLSMHSIREMGGAKDPYHAVSLYKAFYEQFAAIDAETCDENCDGASTFI